MYCRNSRSTRNTTSTLINVSVMPPQYYSQIIEHLQMKEVKEFSRIWAAQISNSPRPLRPIPALQLSGDGFLFRSGVCWCRSRASRPASIHGASRTSCAHVRSALLSARRPPAMRRPASESRTVGARHLSPRRPAASAPLRCSPFPEAAASFYQNSHRYWSMARSHCWTGWGPPRRSSPPSHTLSLWRSREILGGRFSEARAGRAFARERRRASDLCHRHCHRAIRIECCLSCPRAVFPSASVAALRSPLLSGLWKICDARCSEWSAARIK